MSEKMNINEELKDRLPYQEILVDDQLTLRQVRVDEAEKLFDIIDADREYLQKWLPFPEFTNKVQDSESFIETTIQDRIDGSAYGFGIILNGELVGHTSLMEANSQEPKIGYWIASRVSGGGVVTRAASALTDFGINELGLDKIIIRADPRNTASNRVAEKTGYKFDRTEIEDKLGLMNIWVFNN